MAMTLDVDGVTTLDSLNVAEGADFDADVNIDGDLQVDGHANLDSTLTVADFADFNDSLDVEMSVNIQDNLDVNDSLKVNSAGNVGRVFDIESAHGVSSTFVEVFNTNTAGTASSSRLTTPNLTVTDQMNFANDVTIGGTLTAGGNITSGATMTSTTSDDVVTPKGYVDQAIAAAITPPVMYDYDATNSTSNDVIYYINGDLLLYSTEENALINYTITVHGDDMDDVTGASLRARGNSNDLTAGSTAWTNVDANSSTFNIGYTDIVALAGGQTDGYVSCSLSFTTAAGTYNSGLTLRFYLDSTNAAASGATFQN